MCESPLAGATALGIRCEEVSCAARNWQTAVKAEHDRAEGSRETANLRREMLSNYRGRHQWMARLNRIRENARLIIHAGYHNLDDMSLAELQQPSYHCLLKAAHRQRALSPDEPQSKRHQRVHSL